MEKLCPIKVKQMWLYESIIKQEKTGFRKLETQFRENVYSFRRFSFNCLEMCFKV